MNTDLAKLLGTKRDDVFHAVVRAATDKDGTTKILRMNGFQKIRPAEQNDWKAYMVSRINARVKPETTLLNELRDMENDYSAKRRKLRMSKSTAEETNFNRTPTKSAVLTL